MKQLVLSYKSATGQLQSETCFHFSSWEAREKTSLNKLLKEKCFKELWASILSFSSSVFRSL